MKAGPGQELKAVQGHLGLQGPGAADIRRVIVHQQLAAVRERFALLVTLGDAGAVHAVDIGDGAL